MDIKLARPDADGKPIKISLTKLEEQIQNEGQKIFYFDKDNSHKEMMNLIDHFEKKGLSVYFREIKFGLDENDYMYEVHVL